MCKIVQGIAPRNNWSELADQFSEYQICSGQGFDLIIGAIRHHFQSYLEAEPENRGHAHPNSHAQAYPMEGQTISSAEPNHYHNHKTSSDTESDQLDWDPERIDDDGNPLVDENGSTVVPVPREGPLEEDEASSLTAWAQGYREVWTNLCDSVTGRGYF